MRAVSGQKPKLTLQDATMIRWWGTLGRNTEAIARSFGVSPSTIRRILRAPLKHHVVEARRSSLSTREPTLDDVVACYPVAKAELYALRAELKVLARKAGQEE